jgi:hypothetical protein
MTEKAMTDSERIRMLEAKVKTLEKAILQLRDVVRDSVRADVKRLALEIERLATLVERPDDTHLERFSSQDEQEQRSK